ncbi:hypothetical protein WMY93_018378 [Mugilogobius chulae]|uniref:VLIG-type G domain-containing protein n=1 Tax=Mugilogobius chulae TaxID=88201 RepID=A0AAW0NMY1_9GOBI
MTLVNIFGENLSEMQDVLQIVVQAFMRMKKVKLSPSCVFVHQNVSDVSAVEKNMDGKRKLLDKLDKMTQLAATEEVSLGGNSSMAPPNQGYSESVQDLRKFILSKASNSPGVTLSAFRSKVHDLWNALLNENFVFSFKNTLEIAVYRKLEKKAREGVEKRKAEFEERFLEESKELARELKVTKGMKPPKRLNLKEDLMRAVSECGFEKLLISSSLNSGKIKQLATLGDYSDCVCRKTKEEWAIKMWWDKIKNPSGRIPKEHQQELQNFITKLENQATTQIKSKPLVESGYSSTYLSEISKDLKKSIDDFEAQWHYLLLNDFKVDLILYAFDRIEIIILDCHSQFIKNNDVHTYLEKKKDGYYNIFKSFCKGSSSTLVLAELIFCTNTFTNHTASGIDHSVPFHRSSSVNGWSYRGTKEMVLPFCTTEVAGNGRFYPDSSDRKVPYKSYRDAGPRYETWEIIADEYPTSFWQWMVCTFKKDLEKHYNLRYDGRGKIPHEWKRVTFDEAMTNLEEMYDTS